MSRNKAHCEGKEPILENVLSNLRYAKIVRHIPDKAKVLDLGCGYNAGFLSKIAGRNRECFGMDISVNKELVLENVTLIEHDLNKKFPLESESFDIVTSLANLEHLENPNFALSEIFRVLKPGGILLLTTPSVYAKPVLEFLSYKMRLISENEIRDHKNYFCKTSLVKLGKEVGFSKIKHEYFQFFMNNSVKAMK
ncbi:MAG TPA: class I SAM-dependent methyltransferase [Patescibacteria group bacterium]